MADMTGLKDASSRQLRSKLTLLGRRIDELEESTKSLHRTEDELMDIQDKIMQAEGSNCSLLAEVDTLRKRMLTIEGKDEEIRKAEGMCRNLKEKLEAEVKLSKDLKRKIEKLQDRMSELERLEEAFNRSKSDCTQLCLSLNEEKNLTRKLTTELEVLRTRVNELEASESRLDKSERNIIEELEKLKSLAVVLADERKTAGNKLKQNEEDAEERTEKLEPNNKLPATDQSRNSSNLRGNVTEKTGDLWIEESVSSGLAKRGFNPLKVTGNYGPRNKTFPELGQEDNKVKDLTQEIEKLRKRLKLLETVEEDLRKTKGNYNEMQERFLSEQSKAKALAEQVDELKLQAAARGRGPGLENGEPGFQDTRGGRARQERPKNRGLPAEREKERARNRDLLLLEDSVGVRSSRRPLSPSSGRRLQRASSNPRAPEEEKLGGGGKGLGSGQRDLERLKKPRDQPSVLSRYPPAANEPGPGVKMPWGSQAKQSDPGLKYKPEPPMEATDRPKRPPSSWLSNSHPDTSSQSKASDSGEEWPAVNAVPRLLNGTAASQPLGSSRYRQQQQQRLVSPSQEPAHPCWAEGEEMLSGKVAEKVMVAAEEEEEEEEEEERDEEESSSPRQNQYSSRGSTGPSYSRRARREPSTEYRAIRCYMEDEEQLDEGTGETRVLQAELVATISAMEEEEEEAEEAVIAEEAAVVSTEWRPFSPGSSPALRRVCSPRESLRSRAVIQPAIVAIDKKQMMSTMAASTAGPEAEPGPGFGLRRPHGRAERGDGDAGGRSARRAIVTSSICIPPADLPRQRVRGIHTSTGSITIAPAPSPAALSEGLAMEYEISIPRSDITMKPPDSDSDDEEVRAAAAEEEDEEEEEEEEEESERAAEIESVFEPSVRRSSDGNGNGGGGSRRSQRAADPDWRSSGLSADLERTAWRSSQAAGEAKTEPALDFSRVTARRAGNRPPASSLDGPERVPGPGLGGFPSQRFSNFADSAEVRGRPLGAPDDPVVSRLNALDSLGRRNQRTTVAAKVADYNNSCSSSGQEGSDAFTTHNANILLKKKELAKQYLSDISIERLARNETAGKRQSVKVELRKNALGNAWHQPGRSEDRTPVGILSQIRMTSRR